MKHKAFDFVNEGGDLTILASRPLVGKTAFGINLSLHATIENNIPVAKFSIKLLKETLSRRILSSMTGINRIQQYSRKPLQFRSGCAKL